MSSNKADLGRWLAGWPWLAAWLASCLAVAGLEKLQIPYGFNKKMLHHTHSALQKVMFFFHILDLVEIATSK